MAIIKYLNKLLANELTAVHQYLLHYAMLKKNKIDKLAEKIKEELDEEIEHANILANRILLLDGLPNFQETNPIVTYDGAFTKDTIKKILEADLLLEAQAMKDIKEVISLIEIEKDYINVLLLEELLKSEEAHFHWIKTQINLIEVIGIENYTSLMC